ncbi:putative protein kinase RLK-Pelle-CrRLK1L-1 family [Helianthus debilis subsp. tardiflorus]
MYWFFILLISSLNSELPTGWNAFDFSSLFDQQIKASVMKECQHLILPLQHIISATANFDDNNAIISDASGKIYKGEITHSRGRCVVAIQRLVLDQSRLDLAFWEEIMSLSLYTHENLSSLLAFCQEGSENILVHEFALNGSLDDHLNSTTLTWKQRIKICIDAARGLSYLHGDGDVGSKIHRDVKSSNIILGDNWNAKVSLMRRQNVDLLYQDNIYFYSDIDDTHPYLDPMYKETGILDKEVDVYSFGVVLLEVLCGRRCFKSANGVLPDIIHLFKYCYKQKKLNEVIFKELMQQMYPSSMEAFSDIAFQCLQSFPKYRPTMSAVVEKLENSFEYQDTYERVKLEKEYETVLKDVVAPLKYSSAEDLNKLLSKGLLLNGGKTVISYFALISFEL